MHTLGTPTKRVLGPRLTLCVALPQTQRHAVLRKVHWLPSGVPPAESPFNAICKSVRCCHTASTRPPLDSATLRDSSLPARRESLESATGQERGARHAPPTETLSGQQLTVAQRAFRDAVSRALDDRRVMYMDDALVAQLQPKRVDLARVLAGVLPPSSPLSTLVLSLQALGSDDSSYMADQERALSAVDVQELRRAWLGAEGIAEPSSDAREGTINVDFFYTALLESALVRSDADIRTVLADRASVTPQAPGPRIVEAVLRTLPMACARAEEQPESAGARAAMETGPLPASASTELIFGRRHRIDRAQLGDLAGYYMGMALRQHSRRDGWNEVPDGAGKNDGRPEAVEDANELWAAFFFTCALAQVAPGLLRRWWSAFLSAYNTVKRTPDTAASPAVADAAGSAAVGGALPLEAAHAALAWAAASRDIEWAMKIMQEANSRGVRVQETADTPESSSSCSVASFFAQPGSLTRRNDRADVQATQLRFLAKLMATAKSVKYDGGLRALVVRDVKRLVDAPVLQKTAPWGVINDLIGGLSMPSAMQLVKRCARARAGGDDDVPFELWASLLRRCAYEHHLDEAQALFLFIRKRFPVRATEMRELVEIMLRMHAAVGDFASAVDVFLRHVLTHADGEPAVAADVTLYNQLVKAADSRNTAMMVFLEACAAGAEPDISTFENLLASSPYQSVSALSRRLPAEYTASRIDAQLRIPADADAHLRREEALAARGKPLFDSTGESGS